MINTVNNGDMYEFLRLLPANSIDMILADLPYNISRNSNFKSGAKNAQMAKKYNISIDYGSWDKQELQIDILSKEIKRVLKKGSACVLFYDIWKMYQLHEYFKEFDKIRLLQWVKTNPVPKNASIQVLSSVSEFMFCCVKKGINTFNGYCHNGIFKYPILHGKERLQHKTQKPVNLLRDLIEIYTNKNDIVVDFCAGVGSTAIAAIDLGRNYIINELDENYFNTSVDRIKNHVISNK